MISELRAKRQIRDHLLWLLLEVSGLVSVDRNLASACKALASICGTAERGERKREGTRRRRTVSCSFRSDCAYLRTHLSLGDIIRGQELKATLRPFCLA